MNFFFSLFLSFSLSVSAAGRSGVCFQLSVRFRRGSGAVPARSRRGFSAVSPRFPWDRGSVFPWRQVVAKQLESTRSIRCQNLQESPGILENLRESLRILKSEERASPEQFQSGFRAASEQLQGSCCLGATALGEDAAPMKFLMKRFNLIFHKIRSD